MGSGRRLLCTLLLVLTSWAGMALCQGGGGGDGGGSAALSCVQKLMPCRPYLQATAPPPSTCCLPLKEVLADDVQCICTVFNNDQLLKSFNVTRDQALQLPKACGAKADLSLCNNNNNGTTPAPAKGSPPAAEGSPPPPPSTNSAAGFLKFWSGVLAIAVNMVFLIILAF